MKYSGNPLYALPDLPSSLLHCGLCLSTDHINELPGPLISGWIWSMGGTCGSRGENSSELYSSWHGYILLPKVALPRLLSFLDFSLNSTVCSFTSPLQAWEWQWLPSLLLVFPALWYFMSPCYFP